MGKEVTTDELGKIIADAVGQGLTGLKDNLAKEIDEKIQAAKPKAKAEPEGKAIDLETATPGIEVKDLSRDVEYMSMGGYGKKGTPGAYGRFLKDIVRAADPAQRIMSERLRKWVMVTKPLIEGDDEQGGYLVPADIGSHLPAASLEPGIARANGARVYPLRGNRITISADVDSTHVGNFFGGVTVYRPEETGAKTPSKQTFRQIALTLHKLIVFVYASDELLEDSALSIEADISRKASQAISFTEDDDFINGTGVGMALGLLSAITPGGCVIAVPARPLQPAATIIYENIIDMWSRLWARSQNNAIWMCNPGTFPQLATMNMAVGAGGGPVWMPAGGVSGTPYQTLMGRPIIYTEKCQALGIQGDIILADWSQYAIAQKAGGIQAASSTHIYFNYDETAFRYVLRYDGQPTWAIDLTPRRGPTLSPFVVLATRP